MGDADVYLHEMTRGTSIRSAFAIRGVGSGASTASDANVTATLGSTTASYGTLAAGATVSGTLLQVPLTVTSANGTATVLAPVRVGTPTVTTNRRKTLMATPPAAYPRAGRKPAPSPARRGR